MPLTATLTSTEIAGSWPIIGVDDTTGATATATLTQLPGPAAASPAGIYWADELSETLDGVSLDRSDPLSLDTQASLVSGLAAGAVGPVYYASGDGVGVSVRDRSSWGTTGSASGTLVSLPYSGVEDVAVNGSYVYWINGPSIGGTPDPVPYGSIGRANLDGSDADQNFIPVSLPESVAADGSYLYWSTVKAIGRAYVGGGAVNPGRRSELHPGPRGSRPGGGSRLPVVLGQRGGEHVTVRSGEHDRPREPRWQRRQ